MHDYYWYNPQVIDQLKKGGVVCGPTDTVYGLIGLVSNKEAVEKIYSIKKRDPTKSLIVLISDLAQLNKFGVQQSDIDNASHYWPGRISLILNVVNVADYLTRGKPNLAFRLPESKMLRSLIAKTGPLVAPSANPEGQAPALTRRQAMNYFGSEVDYYVGNNKKIDKVSSVILDLSNSLIKQVR